MDDRWNGNLYKPHRDTVIVCRGSWWRTLFYFYFTGFFMSSRTNWTRSPAINSVVGRYWKDRIGFRGYKNPESDYLTVLRCGKLLPWHHGRACLTQTQVCKSVCRSPGVHVDGVTRRCCVCLCAIVLIDSDPVLLLLWPTLLRARLNNAVLKSQTEERS